MRRRPAAAGPEQQEVNLPGLVGLSGRENKMEQEQEHFRKHRKNISDTCKHVSDLIIKNIIGFISCHKMNLPPMDVSISSELSDGYHHLYDSFPFAVHNILFYTFTTEHLSDLKASSLLPSLTLTTMALRKPVRPPRVENGAASVTPPLTHKTQAC